MKPILILIFILISNNALTQSLSQASRNIKIRYEELKSDTKSKRKQLAYLRVFPQNKQQFVEVFDPEDFSQLYSDSFQYIDAFVSLANYYPKEVIDKAINIGKDLMWGADAIAKMQVSIVKLGDENINIFSKEVNELPKAEAARLITYLANVENHSGYPEYQQLIEALQRIGENKLAAQFIHARTLRKKDKNH